MSDPSQPQNVIALSRYRAQLTRGRRVRRAEALFATADPEKAIRALPGDELYYVVSELGFPEALDVLAHATPEQVKVSLDFAIWDRDQVSLERTEDWLGALVEAPPETVAAWVAGLDIELLALLLRQRARIYDHSVEAPPDEPEGTFLETPDRLFTLDLLGEPDQVRVTARLLDALYRDDADNVRRILVGTRSDLDAELEEQAFRWRSGRMADLGFVDFYEALEIYREIDPASIIVPDEAPAPPPGGARADDGGAGDSYLRVPSVLAERLSGSSPFARAAAAINQPEELRELHASLVALSNRVLSADRVTPGDEAAMTTVLTRVSATLDLAIEFLARGSEERAVAAVRGVPLYRLFQLGVSLLGKLRRLARALERETPYARVGRSTRLFEPEDAEVVEAVGRLRPVFPRRLEDPPAAGVRPFATLADVATAAAALERAGAAVALVHALGVRPEQLVPPAAAELGIADEGALDFGVLARTALLPRLVGAAPGPFRAVSRSERAAFEERLAPETVPAAVQRALAAVVPGGRLTPAMAAVAERWAASMAPLEPVLTPEGPTAPMARPPRQH